MAFQRKVFYPKPDRKITEEDKKRRELAWEMLCKNGSVCITNPLAPVDDESIIDTLKRDPHAFTEPFCDYYDATGDMPLEKLEQLANEQRDE